MISVNVGAHFLVFQRQLGFVRRLRYKYVDVLMRTHFQRHETSSGFSISNKTRSEVNPRKMKVRPSENRSPCNLFYSSYSKDDTLYQSPFKIGEEN